MTSSDEVTVVIAAVGLPQLLDVQIRAVRKFLSPTAQVLVLDDSRRRPHYSNQGAWNTPKSLGRVCEEVGAEYRRVPQLLHLVRRWQFPDTKHPWGAGPSLRTADSLQCAWRNLGTDGDSQLVVLDSDLVPIRPLSVNSLLLGTTVAFLPQSRSTPIGEVEYPWPGVLMVNRSEASDWQDMSWDCASVEGVTLDSGGDLWPWIAKHREKAKRLGGLHSNDWRWDVDAPHIGKHLHDFLSLDARFNGGTQFCELFENSLLHLRASSNWMKERRNTFDERMRAFLRGMNALLTDSDLY